MRKINILLGVLFLLSACTGTVATPSLIPPPTETQTPLPTPRIVAASATAAPTLTYTPTSTVTASPIPTPTWFVQGPGDVTVPILLYHRIDVSPINSRYYVPPEKFEQEIKALQGWGYTTISTQMLVQAITTGHELPPHPILITFDDGHLDNYVNAFPIMQKYGFTGVLYIVANYLGTDGFMDRDEILDMHEAGWEVGSHSLNHYDLTKLGPQDQRSEIVGSKERLETLLGIDILTFAYPFGAKDAAVTDYVRFAGYIAAMGAEGYTDSQGEWNLFNLQRVEIKNSEDIQSMTRFLTWHSPAE
jgi:peptidoglycan/xylan/chitin deacetylase (PgdA/CDA1 family)